MDFTGIALAIVAAQGGFLVARMAAYIPHGGGCTSPDRCRRHLV